VQRDLALLLLLAGANMHRAVAKVDIVAVKSERFAGAHPGDGQQPDQRLMARGAQRRSELSCSRDQRRDLGVCVDVWRDPRAMPGQEILGGNLARGVDRREMARESARDGEPLAPGVRVRVHRHPRPRQCQLGGDPLSTRPLEELDEPLQQPAVLRHLKPKPTADAKIVTERVAKRAHATPPSCDGHGRASAHSAVRSTLAYIVVVFCSRWRSTWPISASDAPALSISVATVCRSRCAPTGSSPARRQCSRTIEPIVLR
jgi:hypothetical protein